MYFKCMFKHIILISLLLIYNCLKILELRLNFCCPEKYTNMNISGTLCVCVMQIGRQ